MLFLPNTLDLGGHFSWNGDREYHCLACHECILSLERDQCWEVKLPNWQVLILRMTEYDSTVRTVFERTGPHAGSGAGTWGRGDVVRWPGPRYD
jgi:hypothetical protein